MNCAPDDLGDAVRRLWRWLMAKDIQFPEWSEACVLTVHVVFAAHPADEPKSSVFVSGTFSFKEKDEMHAYYLRAVHEAFVGWPVTIRDMNGLIYIEGPIIDENAERACQHFMAHLDRDETFPGSSRALYN